MLRKKTIEFAWFAREEILQDDRRPFILFRLRGVTKDTRNDRLLVLEERGPAALRTSTSVRWGSKKRARSPALCLDLGGKPWEVSYRPGPGPGPGTASIKNIVLAVN